MSRLDALKSEHRQLQLSYGNLVELYRQLKYGSRSEVSAIVEQIRSRDEILDMSEHKNRLPQPLGCTQLATGVPGSEKQIAKAPTGSAGLLERKSSLALD